GVVLLTVGLTICTVSPSMEIFVAGRAGLVAGSCVVVLSSCVCSRFARRYPRENSVVPRDIAFAHAAGQRCPAV
ncbi:hypothetical protein R6G99_02330, partial [Actinotignum timonense]|nr:hypothetical protein [Actinotignum timonense]